jgi:hypothetical protein
MVNVFAKTYEYIDGKCYVDGILQSSTDSCDGIIRGVLAVLAVVIIPLIILGILSFVFWVWMLVHVVKNDEIKDRTIWLITLILSFPMGLHWLSAPIYYFVVKRPYDAAKKAQTAAGAGATVSPQPTTNQDKSKTS